MSDWENNRKPALIARLTVLPRPEKIDMIRKARVYRSGTDSCNSVYMGGMAVSELLKSLGGNYGKSDLDELLVMATNEQLDRALDVCASFIETMEKHPTKPCPCCGQIVDASSVADTVTEDLLKKAIDAFNALSPEQQAEMHEEQRQSWARGNVGLSRDERAMTSPVMPQPTTVMVSELKPWRYEIKYGPDGEDAYSWVYDDHGAMVATMKTHKAKQIVDAMNTPVAPVSPDATCPHDCYPGRPGDCDGSCQHPEPAPDATGKCGELVTVAQAHFDEFGEFDDIAWIKGYHPHPECIQLVTRSQAVELLAAERAEKEKIAAAVKKLEAAWRDHSQKVATLETQLAAAKKALETKSAANEALSKSVVESIDTEKRLREALEPFSKFAGAVFERNFNNTDVIFEISASDGGVLELTGKDFFEARAVLGGKSS